MPLPSDGEVSASNWFAPNVEYAGPGRAVFGEPAGVVVGPDRARIDEFGGSDVELAIEDIRSDFVPIATREEFFWPGEYVEEDGTRTWGISLRSRPNPCTGFTLTAPDGVLASIGDVALVDHRAGKLRFRIIQSAFDVVDAAASAHWVVPLLNFVSNCAQRHPDLDRHPLRIYPTPVVPEGLSGLEQLAALRRANRHNNLVVFEHGGALGFVERLPDYEPRADDLVRGRAPHLVTAVMVGATGGEVPDAIDVRRWPPTLLLLLLGLATGSEVGSPWVEFRDERGTLVRRVHLNQGQPFFARGHAAFDEGHHRGTGELLTGAAGLPHFGDRRLNAALLNTVRGALRNRSAEEKVGYLVRALDSLCALVGLDRPLPLEDLVAAAGLKEARAAVTAAAAAIRDAAEREETGPRPAGAKLLRRIAGRVENQVEIKRGFGESVVDLIGYFGLPDADIVARHYTTTKGHYKKTWPEVLTAYRGAVVHGSGFDFGPSGGHDIWDVGRIIAHLHDVLVRILLADLRYEGTYQPTVKSVVILDPVDWVKPGTSASDLGYT